ncbi:HNH endonuclease signature motif containing protein [Actinomycetospora sp. C-140]
MSIDHGVRTGLPAALDALAPGAELVAALEGLSPAALTGDDLAAYLRACAREQSRGTARVLDAMHHLGRARADTTVRHASTDEFSGDEICGVLGWSRTMANRKLDLADDLAVRLPEVGDALWEGRLDEPKATRFCEWTRDLADDHARAVCEELLAEAPELPVGELIRRIEQSAAAIDAEWAERRAKRAEKQARVILSPNPTGTATLSVCDVSAPAGLAMRDRVDALAAAVRALGVLIPVGTLRATVAERLLDGSMAGLDDHRVALILAAEYHAQGEPGPADDHSSDDGPSGDEPDDDEPDDGPDEGPDDGPDEGPDDGPHGPAGPDDGPADGGPDGGAADSGAGDSPGDDSPGDDSPGDDSPGDHSPGDDPGDGSDDHGTTSVGPSDDPLEGARGQGVLDLPDLPDPTVIGSERGPGGIRTGTCEVRLRLTTALGLDRFPGCVPGYGTVLAHDARTLVERHHAGEWRVVLTDDDGRLEHLLLARRRPRRPPGPGSRDDARHRGTGAQPRTTIVELQVPTTVLAALNPDDHGDWGPLLTELQQRLRDLGDRAPGSPPPESAADLARRRPRAEVARWLRVRDRHCVAPCCRQPAHKAELDHTLDRALGGPTASWNLGVWDEHHHRAKHRAGWQVRQPQPGHFAIRTRAGVHHTTRPKRIIEPLPAPRPAARPRPLPDDPTWDPDEGDPFDRRHRPTATSTTPPIPAGAVTHPADDPPPF